MNSKRPLPVNDQPLTATILDLFTGKQYDVPQTNLFVIGRSLDCNLLVKEMYISRLHCFIEYANGVFTIYDNNTIAGTYINCKKMISKGEINCRNLVNGDLIGFGEENDLRYVYKFCLTHNAQSVIKKMKYTPENEVFLNNIKLSLTNMYKKIKEIKNEMTQLVNTTNTQMNKFKKMIDDMEKLDTSSTPEDDTIDQQMENLIIDKQALIRQVQEVLEKDVVCVLCNQIICKAVTVSCSHSFCQHCLATWLCTNDVCPVCRSYIHSPIKTLALDNFITSLCDLIGGTLKEKRDKLIQERSRVELPVNRLSGRETENRQTAGFENRDPPRIQRLRPHQTHDVHRHGYNVYEYLNSLLDNHEHRLSLVHDRYRRTPNANAQQDISRIGLNRSRNVDLQAELQRFQMYQRHPYFLYRGLQYVRHSSVYGLFENGIEVLDLTDQ